MTHLITASIDKTARLVDTRTLEVLKVYKAGSPVNAVDMSPTHDHVSERHLRTSHLSLQIVMGGGQEAVDVAIKGSGGGVFESRFFHKVSISFASA